MNDKKQLLTLLEKKFKRWEEVLAGLSETQITTSRLVNGWSVKDLTAHLMAWQQVTTARLEAARMDTEPMLPDWFADVTPDTTNFDLINARIDERYREQPWSWVHQAWKTGFLEVLKLGAEMPETDLSDTGKYPWLKGYALSAVLQGTYEHHHDDHFRPLLAWVRQEGERG